MKSKIIDYPEFLNAVQNNELVYLFGAGISSALSNNTSYSWWQWIMKGISYISDPGLRSALKNSMDSDDSTENLIRVVGEVIKATKAQHSYHPWMKETIEGAKVLNAGLADTLKKLLVSNDVFVTTNYDLLLENATGLKTLSYLDTDKSFRMLDSRQSDSVLHIHGVYDSVSGVDSIVADQNQYDEVLSDKGAQFIQQILGTRTLLLVGCGQTTEDGNISQFIQFAKTYLRMDVPYYFLHKSDKLPVDMPDNIKLIPYGDEYSDLSSFLEEMAQERLKSIISKTNIVGLSPYTYHSHSTDSITKYHFSKQNIPFCGRETELKQLMEFVRSDERISWWSLTGQAGAGKSRLALEMLSTLETGWFGFFINDKTLPGDIDAFAPFSNTVIVIDYVSGRESWVAEGIRRCIGCFKASHYKLRILLIERENSKNTGSWYSKLLQRFGKYENISEYEFKNEFLYIEDLDDNAVESFIDAVCVQHGLDTESDRNRKLRIAYRRKFEQLKYRPLYLQLYVEAWIYNDFNFPEYSTYEDLLRYLLEREQEKWLNLLDGDQTCCNAFIRLLIRANISGNLKVDSIPELYIDDWNKVEIFIKNHSFPGQQRTETKNSLIHAVCQNTEDGTVDILPLFPDLIKEYMFFYYTEDDDLKEMMEEIWQHAAGDFCIFITKCLTDFPDNEFYKKALNIYDASSNNIEILLGRLQLLRRRVIEEDDNPFVLYDLVWNEYEFWKRLKIPEDSEDTDALAALKVTGLNYVAKQFGGWTRYDLSNMLEAIDTFLVVEGGKVTLLMKQIFLQEHIKQTAQAGFSDESAYLKDKLEELLSQKDDTTWSSILHLQNRNVELMDHLLKDDFAQAVNILVKMKEECNIRDVDSVRVFAHSCFNFEYFAFMFKHAEYVGKGYSVIREYGVLYPDDPVLQIWMIGSRISILQYEYFTDRLKDADLLEQLQVFEDKLTDLTNEIDEVATEAFDLVYGMLLTLKINPLHKDTDALRGLIATADSLLKNHSYYEEIAAAKIHMLAALHNILQDKVSHSEIEEVFQYVELNYNSNSLREAFFDLLEVSEDADDRKNYMTKWVKYGARQGASYDPIVGSGIPEFDYEAELLYDAMMSDYDNQEPYAREHKKVGRNEPCPCGSGRKFKKCCLGNGKYD